MKHIAKLGLKGKEVPDLGIVNLVHNLTIKEEIVFKEAFFIFLISDGGVSEGEINEG